MTGFPVHLIFGACGGVQERAGSPPEKVCFTTNESAFWSGVANRQTTPPLPPPPPGQTEQTEHYPFFEHSITDASGHRINIRARGFDIGVTLVAGYPRIYRVDSRERRRRGSQSQQEGGGWKIDESPPPRSLRIPVLHAGPPG